MKILLLPFFLLALSLGAEERIVSLAPSITEIIIKLGHEKELVGVTDFCKDPKKRYTFDHRRIGGMMQANYEAILGKKPSLIFCLVDHTTEIAKLRQLGLKVITLSHKSLDDILKSYQTVGKALNETEKALKLVEEVQEQFDHQKAAKKKDFKVLLSITTLRGRSSIRLWVPGKEGFYDRILTLCGSQNAYTGKLRYTQLSPESLLGINPDLILIIRPNFTKKQQELELKSWEKLSFIPAVKKKRVRFITHPSANIPGAYVNEVLSEFRQTIKKAQEEE